MYKDTPQQLDAATLQLVEGAEREVPKVTPVGVGPVVRLRSPIMEHRLVEPLSADEDGPGVLLPPLRAFVGPSGLALLVAAPVLLVAGWQLAVIAGAVTLVARGLDRLVSRAPFSLGDGFLPYRPETGWPQGVQEDTDVQWNWSTATERHSSAG
jgi:hypothetical protein